MSGGCCESLKVPEIIERWSCEEHARFLLGMTLFPNGPWKRVAGVVKTRTVRQLRTHAQKYRAKLAREEQPLVKCRLLSIDDDLPKSKDDDFTNMAKLLEPIEFTKEGTTQSDDCFDRKLKIECGRYVQSTLQKRTARRSNLISWSFFRFDIPRPRIHGDAFFVSISFYTCLSFTLRISLPMDFTLFTHTTEILDMTDNINFVVQRQRCGCTQDATFCWTNEGFRKAFDGSDGMQWPSTCHFKLASNDKRKIALRF
ncbi:hypothetical protein AeRB84_010091 [Aphanomyces euteiches]|nr:hypothetical protein AeRB84_010091 [Aphanomyces euteiches]